MDLSALHKVGYGLYIVTSKKDDRVNGQIANTVFQITSEPPTVAVSINKQNLTWEFINESRVFAVSVLCEDTSLSFIGGFGFKSGRDVNKFEGVNYRTGKTGAPLVIDNAVACFEVEVTNEMDMGTHTVFAGTVVEADILNNEVCMTYAHYHEVKRGTTPKAAPSYIEEKPEASPVKDKYRCTVCGWIYDPDIGDPDGGIAAGTPFEQVPDDWICPVCGAAKADFEKID